MRRVGRVETGVVAGAWPVDTKAATGKDERIGVWVEVVEGRPALVPSTAKSDCASDWMEADAGAPETAPSTARAQASPRQLRPRP